jgi:hypothetical protein
VANTGYILPQSVVTSAESPWLDDDWVNPTNVTARDGTLAEITDNSYDNGDQSYVLKAYNFNFSTIPTGSTITGVMCRIRARDSVNADIDLVQLLDISRAKVGTNMAATPVAVTTTLADYEFGASNNLWGNSLTESWVKDADFGVAFGMINRSNNADVFCDSIELDVYYTTPAQNLTLTCEVTNYTVTGQNITLTVTKNYVLSCEVTNYAITPQDVTFTKALTLTCELTEYTITGQDVALTVAKNYTLSCELTEYTVTGQDIAFELIRNYILSCVLTEYTVTGQEVTLTYAQEVTLLNAVKSLKYSLDGSPWARLSTKATVNPDTLEYSLDGSPWWGVKPSSLTWTMKSIKYYTGSSWAAKPLKKYVVDTWVEYELKVYM